MSRQMAPWVPLFQQSCKNNLNEVHPFTPFQFSTVEVCVNEDGVEEVKPRVRTVVMRDFLFNDKKTNVLTFNTDLRSEKMKVSPDQRQYFEACFYFPGTWEQYRLNGEWFSVSLNGENNIDDEFLAKYGILMKEEIRSKPESSDESDSSADADDNDKESCNNDDKDDDSDDNKSNESIETNDEEGEITEIIYRFPESKDWKEEVTREWKTLSRSAKSLYRKPPPGEILTNETSKKLDKIQRGVDGTKEDAGLENFAVICLCIDQVDYLNLKDGRGGERRVFRRIFDMVIRDDDDDEDDDGNDDDDDEDNDNDNETNNEDEEDEDEDEEVEEVCALLSGHEMWTEEEVCP